MNVLSVRRLPRVRAPLTAAVLLIAGATVGYSETLEGRLRVLWGDPAPTPLAEALREAGPAEAHTSGPAVYRWFLEADDGRRTELAIGAELSAAHGAFVSWNGRRIQVQVPDGEQRSAPSVRAALALTLLPERGADDRAVLGSRPSVFLMCKFPDVPDEPEDLAYVQGFFGAGFGTLDDYWRANSYGKINLTGSVAIDWVDLPKDRDEYIPGETSTDADLNALFDDCTDAADDLVDFSNGDDGYDGVHMLFNDLLDCCAWGGGRWATLDGVTKVWPTSWNPPWAYRSTGVLAHEMGHSYGLPHANNFDGDSNPYDSPWDVMSAATSWGVSDSTYGRVGKHHTAYHKDLLGWFDADEVLVVEAGSTVTTTVDAMAVPSTTNHRMIKIPIPGTNRLYTVEARDLLGYDGNLPDYAAIITHVDPFRSEPAWAVDIDVPPSTTGNNEGTMFRAGEDFYDPDSGIAISIESVTSDGFQVRVTVPGEPLFTDGFESGDLEAWSQD